MSHPGHFILNSTVTRPDGISVAISVEIPQNSSNEQIMQRAEVLKDVQTKIEAALE